MTNTNRGFIKTIILIVVALLILKYAFNIDLKDIINSKVVTSIWSIIKTIFGLLWTALLLLLDFLKTILTAATNFLNGLNK